MSTSIAFTFRAGEETSRRLEAALPGFLEKQRWYSHKEDNGPPVIWDFCELASTEDVCFGILLITDSPIPGTSFYSLPIAIRDAGHESSHNAELGNAVLCDIPRGKQRFLVYDALLDSECSALLWSALSKDHDQPCTRGLLRFSGRAVPPSGPIRPLHAEQTNSSLVNADQEVLKVIRHPLAGAVLELTVMNALEEVNFPHSMPVLGSLLYLAEGAKPLLLAIRQPFLHNAVEGWALALASLRTVFSEVTLTDTPLHEPSLPETHELLYDGLFSSEARGIGVVTGKMHLALSSPSVAEKLGCEPADGHHLMLWASQMREDLSTILGTLGVDGSSLLDRKQEMEDKFDQILSLSSGGLAIRIHGDYHLGQLLRNDAGWTVVDFGGEPARSNPERMALSSPLRDVAGMLRSFDYVAKVALREQTSGDSPVSARLKMAAERWRDENKAAFWESYILTTAGSPLLPERSAAQRLSDAFELQKALYEVRYELEHRPAWIDIPMEFLASAR